MKDDLATLDMLTNAGLTYRREPKLAMVKAEARAVPGLTYLEFFAGGGMVRAGLGGLPAPVGRNIRFADLLEENPSSVKWHTTAETEKLLNMMSDSNLDKVRAAQRTGQMLVGAVYKRTRLDDDDEKVQRAEIRFDDVAGCLRTAAGGSSRQLVVIVKGKEVRSRLISTREAARLMGLSDEYKLPKTYNEAYDLTGDGVAVPVVRYLAANLLEPILLRRSPDSSQNYARSRYEQRPAI